jgi:hypothetical protein
MGAGLLIYYAAMPTNQYVALRQIAPSANMANRRT